MLGSLMTYEPLQKWNCIIRPIKVETACSPIYIMKVMVNGAPHKNMATIYNKYIVYIKKGDDKEHIVYVLRNGTDVYFPNITSCIYIPRNRSKQIKDVIDKFRHRCSEG